MDKYKNLVGLIGNTPLIEIKYRYKNITRSAYFKCEWYNLSGSIKDRVALQIIKDAERSGRLKNNQTIAEVSSGNMGISLCAVGRHLGHNVKVYMPHSMSSERKSLIKLYGGELCLVESFEKGFEECEKFGQGEVFLSRQFENQSNIKAYRRLCKEVEAKVSNITAVVAGIGTSGTLMGVGGYFKAHCGAKIVAVEPSGSSLFSRGHSLGQHKIQGLSDDIIPDLYDNSLVDDIIGVSDDDAIAMAQKLGRSLGLPVGISGGANFLGCVKFGKSHCLSVFPDDNKKYLSTDLSRPINTTLVDSIQLINYKVL